jgi:Cu/Ag efflux pump CusA
MRVLDVTGHVEGRDVGAVMADVDARLAAIEFPLEHHAEIRGLSAERQADQMRLLAAILAALIGIYLLLQAAFASWRLAAMALLVLPAALGGAVLAGLAAGGGTFSLGALAGLVAVLALAVRSGMLLIVHVQQLERAEPDASRVDLVLRGARDRLAPIVLTALGTAAALLPFVLMGDVAGFEVIRPMAVTILGGLVTSVLLVLFIIPAVYLGSGRGAEEAPAARPVEQPALSPA